MQLMMFLGNDMIDSTPVKLDQLSLPGYLGRFKRMLKDKHADLIRESGTPPEFLVVDPSPAKNQTNQDQAKANSNCGNGMPPGNLSAIR
jgi:hypothetical protein